MGSSIDQTTLPTINFCEKNLEHGSPSWFSTTKDVVRALEDYGCFVAIYDKFSLDSHQEIFEASRELFDLPSDVKTRNLSDTPSHGYVGKETIIPLYEGLGIENATTEEGVNKFAALLWPSGNDSFCKTALEYSRFVAELDQVVMKMVSECYGIEKSYEFLLEKTSYLLRLMKYRVPTKDETSLGIVPHTDKSFMSILHQRQVKGLQVKTKNGHWIDFDPSPSSFIVMAGDACMAWSNGRIEPSSHRVMIEGSEERYSLGLFTFIKDVKVHVPKELVDDDHPLQFKPFEHYKYIHFYYTEEGKRSKCPIRAYCGV